jgi:hypothetical protein
MRRCSTRAANGCTSVTTRDARINIGEIGIGEIGVGAVVEVLDFTAASSTGMV